MIAEERFAQLVGLPRKNVKEARRKNLKKTRHWRTVGNAVMLTRPGAEKLVNIMVSTALQPAVLALVGAELDGQETDQPCPPRCKCDRCESARKARRTDEVLLLGHAGQVVVNVLRFKRFMTNQRIIECLDPDDRKVECRIPLTRRRHFGQVGVEFEATLVHCHKAIHMYEAKTFPRVAYVREAIQEQEDPA